MKLIIIGAGYVGLSYALACSKKADVIVLDRDKQVVESLKNGICPIRDASLESKITPLTAFTDFEDVKCHLTNATVLICVDTPTKNGVSYTQGIVSLLDSLNCSFKKPKAVVLKSTVPVGFTALLCERYKFPLAFAPEFLREGRGYFDVTEPSRLVLGTDNKQAFEDYINAVNFSNTEIVYCTSTEAEAIKYGSNALLAARLTVLNSVVALASKQSKVNPDVISLGIGLDPRIGQNYLSASYSWAGSCFPKDLESLGGQSDFTIFTDLLKANEDTLTFWVERMASFLKGMQKQGTLRIQFEGKDYDSSLKGSAKQTGQGYAYIQKLKEYISFEEVDENAHVKISLSLQNASKGYIHWQSV